MIFLLKLHLLGESAEVSDARALWAAKASRTASPLFLNHALAVTDCMLAFARDCAARTGTRLVDQPELIAAFPAETQALAHPLRLRVSVKRAAETISLCVVPDRLFAIDAPDGRRVFSLELDTGSMSISARRLTKSSFGRKITGYLAAYDQQRYRTQYGVARLRILTVTTTDARIRAMLEAQHAISGGRLSSMFLFTTFTKLAAHGPLAPIWIANGNDAISLLPET